MWKSTLAATIAALILTGCNYGVKPETPNLSIPVSQLSECRPLDAEPRSGKPEHLLEAYVKDSGTANKCRRTHSALIRTLCGQKGVKINGADPAEACR